MEQREAVAFYPNGEKIDTEDLLRGNPITSRLANPELQKAIDGYASRLLSVEETKSFTRFMSLVHDSVDGQAARKGYTANGADGDNALYRFTSELGISAGHSIGEIIYKATEYMHSPREVLLLKICGWAYMEWKYGKYETNGK